jgi:hypothetical protein
LKKFALQAAQKDLRGGGVLRQYVWIAAIERN